MHILVGITSCSTVCLVTVNCEYFSPLPGSVAWWQKGITLFRTVFHSMLGIQYISLEMSKKADREEDEIS